jgi:hypothetical protein
MGVATVPATQTPEPSDAPEPTPSPTEPGLQLEVLEWHRWEHPEQELYRGWGSVYALVRNPYGFPVDVIGTPKVKILDGTGKTVYTSLAADVLDGSLMGIGQILPGETIGVYFCVCGTAASVAIPQWESFQLDFDLREAEPVAVSTDFQLRPYRVFQEESFSVAFTGTYMGHQPLRGIAVRMTVRDPNGNYVGSGEVGILGDPTAGGYESIQPGDPFDYTVSVLLDPALESAALDYELYAVGSLAEP